MLQVVLFGGSDRRRAMKGREKYSQKVRISECGAVIVGRVCECESSIIKPSSPESVAMHLCTMYL